MHDKPIKIELQLYHVSGAPLALELQAQTADEASSLIDALLATKRFTAHEPDAETAEQFNSVIASQHKIPINKVVVSRWQTKAGKTAFTARFYAPFGEPDHGANVSQYLNTEDEWAKLMEYMNVTAEQLQERLCPEPHPARNSPYFDQYAIPVHFMVERKQRPNEKSPTGFSWFVVDYHRLDDEGGTIESDDFDENEESYDAPAMPSVAPNAKPALPLTGASKKAKSSPKASRSNRPF